MKYLKYFEKNISFYDQRLKTLNGLNIPKHVDGDFKCKSNNLTTLEFGPISVNGNFLCGDNELKTLEFCPVYVGDNFNCAVNFITSLEFCPETINGDFDCSRNNLTSLKFCPKIIKGDFNCSDNRLISLDFCPEYVSGIFECCRNNWVDPIPYELIKKYNIDIESLYMDFQIKEFGDYEYQKEFLTETPEKYKDLESIGYDKKIKEEFDWLFNAADMGLM